MLKWLDRPAEGRWGIETGEDQIWVPQATGIGVELRTPEYGLGVCTTSIIIIRD